MNALAKLTCELGVASSAVLGGPWKYFRDAKNKVSKWTLGNNWVKKWDKDRFCVIGLNGQRTDWKVDSPQAAREAVECEIMPPNDQELSHADRDSRQPETRSENRKA
jgi:hypothetical protein